AALDQKGSGPCAVAAGKAVERREDSGGVHPEHRPASRGPALLRRAVEPSVAAAKGVERRQGPSGVDLEHRALPRGAAGIGRAVEASIARLDQAGLWVRAVAARKAMQRR